MKRTLLSFFLCVPVASLVAPAAFGQAAQELPTLDPGQVRIINDHEAKQYLAIKGVSLGTAATPVTNGGEIPLFTYQVRSSRDNNVYTGVMVGQSPFNHGARTTTVPVVVVPVVLSITQNNVTYVFDPTKGDPGCLANSNALALTQNGPIFNNATYVMNGVNVGDTQYIDANQRGEFWQLVKNTGNSYHLLLSQTAGAPLVINLQATTNVSEVVAVNPGTCTNTGHTNQSNALAVVDINLMDSLLTSYITTNGITPSEFPLFLIYNTVMSFNTFNNCCALGYHNDFGTQNNNPGQTYGIADWQGNAAFGGGILDTSVMAHEVGEWANDPGTGNPTPAWGHIGQTSGCQNNLEVGDALTGTNRPNVTMNGFTYHLQELVFFSWFYGAPSIGAGGLYSNNGTFKTDAGPVCH